MSANATCVNGESYFSDKGEVASDGGEPINKRADTLAEKTLFPNAELNLLSPGSGCPLQTGTGHGWPGRAPGRC